VVIVPEAQSAITLTLVTDRRQRAGCDLAQLAREAARSGVEYFQIREKDLSDRALAALASDVVAATSASRTRVLVNGRPDIAQLSGAFGVQLPENGLGVQNVRRSFSDLCIGASCHSLEAAERAEAEGADFVLFGPVFATPGKPNPVGTALLRRVAETLLIPVHAIGGIDPQTAPEAVAAGARGLAAVRAFLEGPLDHAVRSLRGAAFVSLGGGAR